MSELTLFENEIEGSKIVNCQSYAGKNLVFVSNMEYKRTFKYLAHEMIEPQVIICKRRYLISGICLQ